jgi:hypothetical protein
MRLIRIFVVLSAIVFSSCVIDSKEELSTEQDNLKLALVKEVDILDTSFLNKTRKFENNINFWQKDSGDIIVFVNTSQGKQIVSLQGSDQNLLDIGNVNEVYFLEHSFLLIGDNGNIYAKVEKDDERKIFKNLPSNLKDGIIQEVSGYGVNWHKFPIESPIYNDINVNELMEEDSPINVIIGITRSARSSGCDAGGPSSTSCSIAECSTSCSSGSYSCCSSSSCCPYESWSCSCIPDDGSGDS